MSDALSDDIKTDFVNELKDYIPLLRDKADKLSGLTPEASDTNLTELHRLIHAIRGASALIKLNNLSEVASEFETVVEAIMSNRLGFDAAVFSAATNAIDYFDDYAKAVPCDDAINQAHRIEILTTLRDIGSQASSDDEQDLLSQLLKAADQDADDGPLVFNAGDLSFDEIDGPHDHFALTEDELADVVGNAPQKDSTANAAESIPVDSSNRVPQADSPETPDIPDIPDIIDLPQAELIEGFYQESEDHFQDLGKAISELEERTKTATQITAQDKERLRLIRRSVHTVKGAASVVKLKPIASWGHEFENVLDWLYEKAEILSPDIIKVIANATDILENLVTDPQKVDPAQLDLLRIEFEGIVASGAEERNRVQKSPPAAAPSKPADVIEVLLPPEEDRRDLHSIVDRKHDKDGKSAPSPDISRTMRVDLAKVKALVNISGELTIALSAFDPDMDDLDGMIGEIDRTHYRLKKTARDLELGYEGKAIGQVDSPGPIAEIPDTVIGDESETISEFDLLELDRYSELSLIIRSLSEAAADAGTISHQLARIQSGFKGYLHHLHILASELNEKTMRMRMTPMSSIANRMRRTVRETASQLDKKVRLTIKGEHIELDKFVWDKLADPLMHLLRNAVDHGVEPEAARRKAGKSDTADIQIEAVYQGNQVVLRISDDGPGIDYDAIRNATIVPDAVDNETITQQELTDMIFQPGFSTRQTISEVSGRGVGLDVVKENILGLKGSVSVEKSTKDAGTTFLIKLPLTMAVIKALIFEIRGRRYATSLYDIKEILRVNPKDLAPQGDRTIYIGGRRLPYYNLSDILEGPGPDLQTHDTTQWPLLLIIEKETWQGAVAIDRMYNQRDIVIKNLGNHLGQVKGITGATVMGDGKVVPILNLEELIGGETDHSPRPIRLKPKERIQKPLEIMVVDDSVTIRNVVSRLMKRQGWNVLTAKDGMEAIETLHNRQPDLVILDVEMPRMNGYEFMSSIRAQAEFNDLPVIMHTSRASKKHKKKAKALGVNGFVTKPYKEEEFIAMVKELALKN